jgi:hypothetical protein
MAWVRVDRQSRLGTLGPLLAVLAAVLPLRDPVATPSLGAIRALLMSVSNGPHTPVLTHLLTPALRSSMPIGLRLGLLGCLRLGPLGCLRLGTLGSVLPGAG